MLITDGYHAVFTTYILDLAHLGNNAYAGLNHNSQSCLAGKYLLDDSKQGSHVEQHETQTHVSSQVRSSGIVHAIQFCGIQKVIEHRRGIALTPDHSGFDFWYFVAQIEVPNTGPL